MSNVPLYRGLGREPRTEAEWDALLDYQATTPVWIVLHDPNVYDDEPTSECWTEKVVAVLGRTSSSRCFVTHPKINLTIRCRTCGIRTFVVCGNEVHDVKAGVAHSEPWCVYCTEAVAEHEVVEVL